ncbi:hypothetical protein ABVT39_018978, partial [Epinephelus coioides]
ELADSFAGRQKNDSPETEKEKEKEEVSHKVVPIEQAVSELKDQLKCDLKSLQDKRDKYKQ